MSRARSLAFILTAAAAAVATPIHAETPPALGLGPGVRLQDVLGRPDETIVERPDGTKTTVGQLKIQLKAAPRATGESPGKPGLSQKLNADLLSANAAARAALARVKQVLAPGVLRAIATPTPGHLKIPCYRSLFDVDGAGANFQIQPGQLILLNGCFAGAPNAEVRIVGNFPPYGYLLLSIQDRGDAYFYGQVPDVSGVPDQSVSISIRFFDGTMSNARSGFFYAKRQTWTSAANQSVCHGLLMNGAQQPLNPWGPEVGCGVIAGPGVDSWASRAKASGFRISKFWWTAVTTDFNGSHWSAPTSMVWSDDGTTVLVSHGTSWYGASAVQIEGPAGIPPF